ncbi:hypothetical protein LTR62_000909 [Meristemomyces frigidus]|uniref:Uncharacterized protein n=1 Tax=Meristemomyces frigidus TaxID=1508187 RepID=A0AAN7T8I5_9PEZI|nr:hypothetical protein LTR62_000909 [Meristemomyces frigidus]
MAAHKIFTTGFFAYAALALLLPAPGLAQTAASFTTTTSLALNATTSALNAITSALNATTSALNATTAALASSSSLTAAVPIYSSYLSTSSSFESVIYTSIPNSTGASATSTTSTGQGSTGATETPSPTSLTSGSSSSSSPIRTTITADITLPPDTIGVTQTSNSRTTVIPVVSWPGIPTPVTLAGPTEIIYHTEHHGGHGIVFLSFTGLMFRSSPFQPSYFPLFQESNFRVHTDAYASGPKQPRHRSIIACADADANSAKPDVESISDLNLGLQLFFRHILWEVPGFLKRAPVVDPDTGRRRDGLVPNSGAENIKQLLTPIQDGDPKRMTDSGALYGKPWLPGLMDLSKPNALFDPSQPGGVQAFFVTPGPLFADGGGVASAAYGTALQPLSAWLNVQFRTNTQNLIYARVHGLASIADDFTFARGKVLFLFDPEQYVVPRTFETGNETLTCPVTYAAWQLWVGGQATSDFGPTRRDAWAATIAPGTGTYLSAAPTGVQRRQIPAGCSEVSVSTSVSISAPISASTSASTTIPSPSSTASVPTTFTTVSFSSEPYSTTSVPTTSSTVKFSYQPDSTTSTTSSPSPTSAPPITSCTLYTASAFTENGMSVPAETACSCNDGRIVGINTIYGALGIYELQRDVGSSSSSSIIVSAYLTTMTSTSGQVSYTLPGITTAALPTPTIPSTSSTVTTPLSLATTDPPKSSTQKHKPNWLTLLFPTGTMGCKIAGPLPFSGCVY